MEAYLRTFMAVYQLSSIRGAARLLNKSEPAVSYQIHSLEQNAGARLFDRVGRNIVPNRSARRLYETVRPLLESLDRAAKELRDPRDDSRAAFWVSSVSGFGRYVLAPLLARMRGIPIRLTFCTAEETWANVKSGKADVGFSFKRAFDSALEFNPVYREELVLISPQRLRRFDLEAAETAEYVTYSEGDWVFSKWFEDVLRRQPRTILESHSADELEEVIAFVAAGHGISIVPLDSALRAITQRRIFVYRPGGKRCFNWVFSSTRSNAMDNVTANLLSAIPRSAGGPAE